MYDDKVKSYVLILKTMLLGFVFFNAFQIYQGSVFPLIIIGVCLLLLALNDFLRKFKQLKPSRQTASLLVSIAGAAVIQYFVPGIGAAVYIFLPLFELFYMQGARMKVLLTAHAAAYFTVLFLGSFPFGGDKTASAGTATLLYLGVACMSYLLHANGREKEEIKKLNEDLTASNSMLIKYARQAEELTIVAERSRVAQELHDSLGHSLMALSMNLEYAEKSCDSNPEQVREALVKAKELSKRSISGLRNAVEALKNEQEPSSLADSIAELAQSLGSLAEVDIGFTVDPNLENMNAELKICIYKAVREGLTNSLAHGRATAVNVQAQVLKGTVQLQIKDNGAGCAQITESTGLLGIRQRVESLGGRVDYRGSSGFEISVQIPVAKEELQID
ncbi:MAG: sensor histidine kinase [Eubacteriales bacterium]